MKDHWAEVQQEIRETQRTIIEEAEESAKAQPNMCQKTVHRVFRLVREKLGIAQ